ncbi:c-type cytochrome [Aminobacter sp. HY435]|uniref:c-type cytochrome n=1 Tax=Aminobacter sp. HY435 TaxID=2970917 RepID=UPI0022B94E03|nr:cytochrome c family protein [Aminobacter sp. HY435]
MDSFEINKILGGLLGTAFVVFSVSLASDAIFASPVPEKPGFAIEAAEEGGGAAGGGEAAPAAVPIAQLLASANAEAGAAVFKKCTACHSIEKGGPNKVGPDLWGVVNRPIASHEGFAYSGPMKEFSEGGKVVWDFDHLNHFLTSPKGLIKGTAMGFAGIKKDDERANLIAYLNSQSDAPAPLPAVDAAPAAEPAAAPAEGAAPAAPAEGAAPAAPAAPAEGAAPAPAAH